MAATKRRKPKDERKDELLRVRVTAAEKAAWTAAAQRDGRELSGWLRFIANCESGAVKDAPRE